MQTVDMKHYFRLSDYVAFRGGDANMRKRQYEKMTVLLFVKSPAGAPMSTRFVYSRFYLWWFLIHRACTVVAQQSKEETSAGRGKKQRNKSPRVSPPSMKALLLNCLRFRAGACATSRSKFHYYAKETLPYSWQDILRELL